MPGAEVHGDCGLGSLPGGMSEAAGRGEDLAGGSEKRWVQTEGRGERGERKARGGKAAWTEGSMKGKGGEKGQKEECGEGQGVKEGEMRGGWGSWTGWFQLLPSDTPPFPAPLGPLHAPAAFHLPSPSPSPSSPGLMSLLPLP